MWAIEAYESVADLETAKSLLAWAREQVDYLGGRILPPTDITPRWRVQVIYRDAPAVSWLPDGLKRCWIPRSVWRSLGIIAGNHQ